LAHINDATPPCRSIDWGAKPTSVSNGIAADQMASQLD
jgi:hypothetical protein